MHCEVKRDEIRWLCEHPIKFYLNRPNKNGWGTIYAYFRFANKSYRVPTSIRVRQEFWSTREHRILIGNRATIIERDIHIEAEKQINNIVKAVNTVLYGYLCQSNITNYDELLNSIIKIVNFRYMSKKNDNLKIALLNACEDFGNAKTKRVFISVVQRFEVFMKECNIQNSLQSVNMQTMRQWRNWLDENVGAKRAQDCLGNIFNLLRRIERKEGYDFKLNPKALEQIADKRTRAEKSDNHVALTHDEIECLLKLEELSINEEQVRDLFVLQCWCGVRFEDLSQLLSSKNIKELNGLHSATFCPLKTKKRGIQVIIPLDNPNLYPALELVNKYQDKCPYNDTAASNTKYNELLKSVALKAKLDRIIDVTEQAPKGEIRKSQRHIHDIISSHDGRHTFITNCLRYKKLAENEVSKMSGHVDERQIKETYDNSTTDDKITLLNDKLLSKKQQPTAPTAQLTSLPYSIDEAKRVLNFYGVNPDKYMEIDNLDDLLRLISVRESLIIKGFDKAKLDKVKEIFNENADIVIRKKHLHNLIEIWESDEKTDSI